ncbi:hypothetical protein GGS21DRAFT_454827 [Xylaria nigripes]|nr:hypothetical protein GGS21DRAFT_454827 [Xylaria nigripes]
MPPIGAVMARSLQDRDWRNAFASLLSRSAVAALGKRQAFQDISGDINNVKTAFSSWDNCFKAAICKWPVIALFIVAGLIILSILWCIIRCCCCGLSCCCECFYCLKCCGECFGMCSPPRSKRNKYLDEPFVPTNHEQAYRSQAPMIHGLEPMKPNVPQYASFDASHKDADALPAMPSWEGSSSKKVLVEDESVEMDTLRRPSASHGPSPLATSPAQAISPYGPPGGAGHANGYRAPPKRNNSDAYRMSRQSRNDYGRGHVSTYSADGMNGMMGVATAGPLGRQAPHGDYNSTTGYDHSNMDQGYAPYPPSRSPRPNNDYGRSVAPASYNSRKIHGVAVPPNDSYGNDRRYSPPQAGYNYGIARGSPSPGQGYDYGSARASPASQASYGMPQPSSAQDHFTQQYPDTSHQEHPAESLGGQTHSTPSPKFDAPRSPIRNNSGFDFNSGYSRPPSRPSPALAPPPAPATTANGGPAYPGYRAYKPAQPQSQSPQQQDTP